MEMVWIYSIIAVIIVSLVALIAAIPLLIKKKVSEKTLLLLMSLSVGVLLSTVFINFLPEATSHGYTLGLALNVIIGFLVFFVLEKLIHWHHHRKEEKEMHAHSHAYHLAPINLIGDAIHNFIDGLVIAGSFAVNTVVGITATISIIFHELPQEIADMGILLYSGLSKKKAVIFNLFSASSAIIGAIIGLLLFQSIQGFNEFILPFAAGAFLYIAASNLVPQLHRSCGWKDSVLHLLVIIVGVGMIVLITLLGPGHVH